MLMLIVCTLVSFFFLVFIVDTVNYNLYKAKVNRGEFGAKYNTPRHIGEFIRNVKFLISLFKQKWRT